MATTSKDIGRFLEARLQEKGADAVMTYKDLITVFSDLPDLGPFWSAHPLCAMFGELDIEDASANRPFRTAIVVNQDDRFPGPGFFKMYVKYRDKHARCRSDEDKIVVHQRELKELSKFHYRANQNR